jgi:RNA polymerase sigma-70 factor, ECF subfamily
MDIRDDIVLVRLCLEGERSSFEVLVKKYATPIYNLALRMVNDSENAADITQTTFIKAYERLNTFKPELKFFSWLYRIAIHEALNFKKKQKRTEVITEEIVSNDLIPDEAVHQVERNDIIQKALMDLPSDHRSVIVLRHFGELSYDQISTVLGIPEKKVKSRLYSARQRLREILLNKGL